MRIQCSVQMIIFSLGVFPRTIYSQETQYKQDSPNLIRISDSHNLLLLVITVTCIILSFSFYSLFCARLWVCTDTRLCTFLEHTHSVCIVQFEAAEDMVSVSGMEKPIASHHHLETLWGKNKKSAGTIRKDHTHA